MKVSYFAKPAVMSRRRTCRGNGRRLRPAQPDDDPWYFHQFNANKKIGHAQAQIPARARDCQRAVEKADVTVENMAPGTIERLGLGYDVVKGLNPGIIYCQVKDFGAGSPHRATG
jgi:formyl-CoA transferase